MNHELVRRRAGAFGELGCFSFFPSKNLGAFGDGGMVTTNDPDRAEKLRVLRAHGSKPKYYHKLVGGNFRLDTLQAAIVLVKLRHLDAWTAARQSNAARYDKLFRDSGLVDAGHIQLPMTYPQITPIGEDSSGSVRNQDSNLWKSVESVDEAPAPDVSSHKDNLRESVVSVDDTPTPLSTSTLTSTSRHVVNQYVIRAQRRNELQAHLKDRGIGTEVYYPLPLHLQECFAHLGHNPGAFPESEKAAQETLALPIYPELSDVQAKFVVDSVRAFYQP
jgi:dTDP-4-amino-4,6-dideoxygalactose transaminase